MRSFKRIWVTLLLALAMAITYMPMTMVTSYAAAGDPPAHSKNRTDNHNGTYQIELTVTGDADDETEEDSHVNVLVIYDESSSMRNDNPARADVAENAMYNFIDGLVAYQARGVDIYMAEVGFGTGSNTRSNWTSTLTTIRGHYDEGVDGSYNGGAHGNYNYNGTNWASAFERADGLLDGLENIGGQDRSSYPTFVVLVTDGGPTMGGGGTTVPGPNVPWTSYRDHYLAATTDALSLQTRTGNNFYGIYALGTDANLLDDLMYYANTGNHRTVDGYSIATASQSQHDFALDEGADNYYGAADATALDEAISEIFNEIVKVMGITEVSMTDGTTQEVKASSGEVANLLGVIEDYKYYMSIPVDSNNQFKRKKNVDGSAEEITYTVNGGTVTWTEGGESKSVTLNGSVKNGQFKFEWTKDDFPNDFYEYAPEDAELVDGSVEWDLSNVGVLLDGVTYSVTFDVYPSQTALDYKARLENGEDYDTVVDSDLQKWFHEDGSVETNTGGGVTYSDSRDGSGPNKTDFEIPGPVPTKSEEMTIEKEWEGGSAPSGALKMDILMDGDEEDPFYEATLSGDDWNAIFDISAGLIVDGEALPDAMGHEFSFAELGSEQYRWELHAPVVRPMIIDGADTPTMLIKADPENGYDPAGKTQYEIDGTTYYVDPAVTSLKATNHRRSNLNIAKVVTGEDAPADAEFPFTFNINNIKKPETPPAGDDSHSSDYWVWFSVRDKDGKTVERTTNATLVPDASTGDPYYYAESGTDITVNLKAGDNLRFTNLPSGTTYTAVEGNVSGFKLTDIKNTGADDSTFDGDTDTKTASGTIEKYDATAYGATFTNEYSSVDVTVTKVWADGNDQDKIRPEELELTLNNVPDDFTAPDPVVEKDGDTWTYTWSGLPQYGIDGSDIEYTVSEETVPDGYQKSPESAVSDGETITNTHTPETINVKITKEWAGDTDISGIVRPETIQAQLKANGKEYGDPVTLDADHGWSYTWENLPKNSDGSPITYTADETAVPAGYVKTGPVTEETDNGLEITVTNTYDPTPVLVDPPVQKNISGTDKLYNKGHFTFTIENTSCPEGVTAPMPENTSITNTDVYELSDKPTYYEFGEIEFTVPGTYEYTVKETGSAPGVTNDKEAATGKTLTFEVAFDDDGNLTVSPTTDQVELSFTNVYDASGSVILKAKKVLEGKTLTENQFNFVVYDSEDKVVATGTNDEDGLVTFSEITGFKLADAGKTFEYTIKEVIPEGATGNPPKLAGVIYDNTPKTVHVDVSDEGTGTLVVEPEEGEDDLVFNNKYVPDEGSTSITVNKTLDGREIQGGEFSFKMTQTGGPADGDSVPDTGLTAVLTAEDISESGTTGSRPLSVTYTKEGTYTYTIVENVPDGFTENPYKGVTYDRHEETITVDVVDENGQLVATPSKDSVAFENSYETKGDGKIDILKVFKGKNWTDEEFKFELYDSEGKKVGETKTLTKEDLDDEGNAKGSFELTDLTPGTYTYTVKELAPESSSEADDESADEQTPADAENENADQTEDSAEAADAPDNSAATEDAEAAPEADEEAPAEAVTDEPAATEEEPAATEEEPAAAEEEPAATEEEPTVSALFESLLLTAYAEDDSVTEKTENGEITYDPTGTGKGYEVTVSVVDNLDGTCTVSVKYPSGEEVTFTNQYEPNPVTVNLKATKRIIGKDLAEGMFQFRLSGNGVDETVANDAEGKITFPQLSYTLENAGKTYTYNVEELDGGLTGITYDTTQYSVKVTVSYDADEGKLSASVSDNAKNLTFINTYKPEEVAVNLEATKTLNGADLREGQFSFVVQDSDGNIRATGTNDASGKVRFGEMLFDQEGTFKYTIKEVNTGAENITYDTKTYPVTIKVTDNNGKFTADVSIAGGPAKFVNTYTPPEDPEKPEEPDKPKKPDTGDSNDLAGMLGLMAASAAGLGYLFIRRRREGIL